MINNEIYQYVWDEISVFLPESWDRVVIHLDYEPGSYSIEFFVRSDGTYTKCFDLPEIDEDELFDAFERIDAQILKAREETPNSNWTDMTMVVDAEYNMHTDFEYEKPSDDLLECINAWKKKYLTQEEEEKHEGV